MTLWREVDRETAVRLIASSGFDGRLFVGAQCSILMGCSLFDDDLRSDAIQTSRWYLDADGLRIPVYETVFTGADTGRRVIWRLNAAVFPMEGSPE